MTTPPPPSPRGPDEGWEHFDLYRRVIDALHSLPDLFDYDLPVSGIRATDLYAFSGPLGTAIEASVVESLNKLRKIWDPDDKYQRYTFVRQPQAFPDVRLETDAPAATPPILMGVELKGWFALAKEGEPSFRYKATPNACAPQDLLAIYPWTLSDVISGRPRLLKPFIVPARYAAEHRNYYWEHLRGVDGERAKVEPAPHQTPYPSKADQVSDRAKHDSGGNFGRVARGGFVTEFVEELDRDLLSGIPLAAWRDFIKIFKQRYSDEELRASIRSLQARYKAEVAGTDKEAAVERVTAALEGLFKSFLED